MQWKKDYWGEKSEEKILQDLKMHLILSEGLRLQLGQQFQSTRLSLGSTVRDWEYLYILE